MKFNKLFFVLLVLTLISMASLVKIRRTEAEAATETDAEAERKKRKDNGVANNAGNNAKANNVKAEDCLNANSKLNNTKEGCQENFGACFVDGALKVEIADNDTKCKDLKAAINAKSNNKKENATPPTPNGKK